MVMMRTATITLCKAWSCTGLLVGGSHHVVSGAGVLARQLRAALLLSEGLLLVSGAAVPAGGAAHLVILVAFLLEPRALVYIQLADAHLDPWVAGHMPASSYELLVLLLLFHGCSRQQQSLYVLLCLTLALDRGRRHLWVRRGALASHPRFRLRQDFRHRGRVRRAYLWNECWSRLRRVFGVRGRWGRGVAYNFFIIRKLAVVPKPWWIRK